MTSCPEALRILEFEKKRVRDLNSEQASRFSELTEAKLVVCGGGAACGGVRRKSQDRKKLCVSLSPHVEKP